MANQNTKRENKQNKYQANDYFAKLKALNEIIDQGGEAAKDARIAKDRLSNSHFRRSSKTRAGAKGSGDSEKLDRLMLPGSFENGKRR